MAVTLNASTSAGLVQSADLSGEINIQSNGSTVLGVTSTGASVTGTQSVSGNLSFNSGYGSVATAFGCRAWVKFNGTGTPAINGSGNVSSITDNSTGNYTVNFTTAMPDANYAVVTGTNISVTYQGETTSVESITTASFVIVHAENGSFADTNVIMASVFR